MASLDGAAANLVGRRVKALGVPEHRLDTASVAALRLLEAAQAFETAAGGARAHVQLSNLTDNSDVVWARLHESLDGMRAGTPAARDAFSAALRHAWAPLVRTKVHVATPGVGVNGHPEYGAAGAGVPQTSVAPGYDASPAAAEQRRLSFSAEQAHVGATTASTPTGHTPASTAGSTPGTDQPAPTRKRAPYLLRPTGVDRETWKSFTREQRLETVSQYNAVVGAPKRAKLDAAVAAAAPAAAAAAAPAAGAEGAPAAGDEAAMIANAAVAAAAAAANVMEDGGGGGAGGAALSTGAVSTDMDAPAVGGSAGSGGGNHSGAGRPKTYLTRPRSVEVALWKSLNREQRLELVAKHAGVDAVMPTVKRTKPVGLAAQAVANSSVLDSSGIDGGEAAGGDGAVAATLNAPEGGEGGGGGEGVMGDFATTPFPEAT
ncbi:hypothetical protein MMPV_004708 [Pyropia vietnamensis]